MKSSESNTIVYTCSFCGDSFSRKKTMTLHKSYCSENPKRLIFKCKYCNELISRKDSIIRHIKTIHSDKVIKYLWKHNDEENFLVYTHVEKSPNPSSSSQNIETPSKHDIKVLIETVNYTNTKLDNLDKRISVLEKLIRNLGESLSKSSQNSTCEPSNFTSNDMNITINNNADETHKSNVMENDIDAILNLLTKPIKYICPKLRILIDTKERKLNKLLSKIDIKIPYDFVSLDLGDMQFIWNNKIVCIIERKTIQDYASSVRDGRSKRQSDNINLFLNNLNTDKTTFIRIIYILEGNKIPNKFIHQNNRNY